MSKLQLKSKNIRKTLPFTLYPFRLQRGQSLVELLLAIAFAGIIIPVIFSSFLSSREGKSQNSQRLIALPSLQDLMEVSRVIREKDWNAFAINGTYYPVVSGQSWVLTPGIETKDGLFRSITVSDVQRDTLGAIVQSGGVVDPSTKLVVSSVWWTNPYTATISATMYLTRYLANQIFSQTNQADFNAGTKTNVSVTSTGEVTLAEGGNADWCTPQSTMTEFDLPKQGVANAISAIEGRVFAGTGENASGVSFANISISNTSSPSGTLVGTFDGYKTNGVFGETNYAYLATDTNSKEVVILDLTSKDSNNNYSEIGYFDAPGNNAGSSVYVSGNIGYVTVENKLYTFDLSSNVGSRPQLGSVSLLGTATKVKVVGNYAYVSLDGLIQLHKILVSADGRTLSVKGLAFLNGSGARDVFINSTATRAYITTKNSSIRNEFFIVDISPSDPPPWWPFPNFYNTIGSYNTGSLDPKDAVVVTANKAIIVGVGGEQYQVINIANESSPTRCGGMTIATGINGIATVLESDLDAYSYIITGDANSELKIIRGGPGGGLYSASGTFESSTIAATSSAAFNSFVATVTKPAGTDITFQVAVANAIGNSCNGVPFDYRGPDGTGSTYFGSAGTIPVLTNANYANPGQCFRYKAYLSTTNQNATPTLYDMTVNYSP